MRLLGEFGYGVFLHVGAIAISHFQGHVCPTGADDRDTVLNPVDNLYVPIVGVCPERIGFIQGDRPGFGMAQLLKSGFFECGGCAAIGVLRNLVFYIPPADALAATEVAGAIGSCIDLLAGVMVWGFVLLFVLLLRSGLGDSWKRCALATIEITSYRLRLPCVSDQSYE